MIQRTTEDALQKLKLEEPSALNLKKTAEWTTSERKQESYLHIRARYTLDGITGAIMQLASAPAYIDTLITDGKRRKQCDKPVLGKAKNESAELRGQEMCCSDAHKNHTRNGKDRELR